MGIIDLLLNLAGLLLWVSWRSLSIERLAQSRPASLAGAVQRAAPPRSNRWFLPVGLGGLLILRALLYWQIGSAVDWVPDLRLGPINVFFRSDRFWLMLLYSALGFAVTLTLFYLCLLLLALVNGRAADADPVQTIVRLHLGAVARWPWPVKLLLPLVGGGAAWLMMYPLLARLELINPVVSAAHRFEQAALIGLGAYLTWKYLIGVLLFLSLLATYVYLGSSPVWAFVLMTGRNLVAPLRRLPLRVGKVDLAPVVVVLLIFFAAEMAGRGLTALYSRLAL